jgi:hypothetical protein
LIYVYQRCFTIYRKSRMILRKRTNDNETQSQVVNRISPNDIETEYH